MGGNGQAAQGAPRYTVDHFMTMRVGLPVRERHNRFMLTTSLVGHENVIIQQGSSRVKFSG